MATRLPITLQAQAALAGAVQAQEAAEEAANRIDLGDLDAAVAATAEDRATVEGLMPTIASQALAVSGDASTVATLAGTTATHAASVAAAVSVAEAARDAAYVNANVYASTADGLAAVADGVQFQVVTGNEVIRYKRVTASTATVVARYPTSASVFGTATSNFDTITSTGPYVGYRAVGEPLPFTQTFVYHLEATRGYQIAITQRTVAAGSIARQWFRYRSSTGWDNWREVATTDILGALASLDTVSASAQAPGDRSSIYPDPAMTDASLYSGAAFSILTPTVGATPAVRKAPTIVQMAGTTAAAEMFGPAFPVEAGAKYVMSGTGGRITGVGSVTTRFMANWYSDHAATTIISSEAIGADSTSTSPVKRKGKVTAPATAVACRISFQKDATASVHTSGFFDLDVIRELDPLALPTSGPYTPPTVTAVAALVTHISTIAGVPNADLYSKAPSTQIAPASLTKVMTAVTALSVLTTVGANPDTTTITVTASDEVGGSGANVAAGDVLSLNDALINMMLPSSNNTASAVARSVGALLVAHESSGTDPMVRFVAQMNTVAASLGMASSTFKNPTGLPSTGQLTTAADINRLMVDAANTSRITATWGLSSADLTVTGPNARTVSVTHSVPMISDADVLGGKSGTLTPSIYNATIVGKAPNGNRVIATVLQSSSTGARYTDLRAMLNAVISGHAWPVITPAPY